MSDSSLFFQHSLDLKSLDIGRLFCHSYNIMVGYGNFEGEEEGGDKNRASFILGTCYLFRTNLGMEQKSGWDFLPLHSTSPGISP